MVVVQKPPTASVDIRRRWKVGGILLTVSVVILWFLYSDNQDPSILPAASEPFGVRRLRPNDAQTKEALSSCPYQSLSDLSPEERHPQQGNRHMVTPPSGGQLSLVCCETTAGPLQVLAHHAWAPRGAQRFLDMVNDGYFNEDVPLMRCVHNFLCQFGLAGEASNKFRQNLQDDENWLPAGPNYRQNEDGVRRFAKGYLAYAGHGANSRTNQFIVGLKGNGPLGGGSPWEVPWGELVGSVSFETLDNIHTGYGEKGPPQGLLWKADYLDRVREDWPHLDHITRCTLVDQAEQS